MPKHFPIFTLTAWVKNVYTLRTAQGTNGDKLHTGSYLTQQFTHLPVHNPQVIPLFVQVFTSQLSTLKINHFNLLNRRLYPQSTPPINMKKKKI